MNETPEERKERQKVQRRGYYLKMKSDPVKWAAYKKRSNINTAKWYQKIKHDFSKYEMLLKKQNERHRKYRLNRSEKFLAYIERNRLKRELNPFHARELKRLAYARMKRDPVRYRKWLDRTLNWYYTMKKDPERYRRFLEDRKVYQRYRKIMKKAALMEVA